MLFFNAGIPLQGSHPPYPPCPKEDLEPLSKPLANRWQEDVTDSGGVRRPLSGFWYGSQAFAPSGFAIVFYTSPPAPPLEGKGWLRTENALPIFYGLLIAVADKKDIASSRDTKT